MKASRTFGPAALRGGASLAALLVLLICGCTQARFEPQNQPSERRADSGSAVFTGEVQVLSDYPPAPFERLGVVIVSGSGLTSAETLLSRLKHEAAMRGADTVVLQSSKPLEHNTAAGHINVRWAGFALRTPPRS